MDWRHLLPKPLATVTCEKLRQCLYQQSLENENACDSAFLAFGTLGKAIKIEPIVVRSLPRVAKTSKASGTDTGG